jgi:hypothetical protein
MKQVSKGKYTRGGCWRHDESQARCSYRSDLFSCSSGRGVSLRLVVKPKGDGNGRK